MEDLCPQLSIATILQEKKDKDFISLVAFVSIDNRPVVSTTLKNSLENINKKEVAINDNTGVIKLTLWGTLIDMVPVSGVYEIINAKIREWPAGVLTITTTPSTTITPSSQKILPWKSSLKELMSTKVSFPPDAVKPIVAQKVCPNCSARSETDAKLFKCSRCNTLVLNSKLKSSYTLKLLFTLPKHQLVTVYHKQLRQ